MSSSLLCHMAAHASCHASSYLCLTAAWQHDVGGNGHGSALFIGGKREATAWRGRGRGRGRVVVAAVEDGRGRRGRKCCQAGLESISFERFGRTAMLVAVVGVTSVTSSLLFSPSAMAAESIIACQEELGGADPNTVFIVACVVEFLALTGAAVGGILARQRKHELELINSQLRQINISLRKQARVESYAPSLSYAPVGTPTVASRLSGNATAVRELEVDTRPKQDEKDEVVRLLKSGKKYLREQKPLEASVQFEKALNLAKAMGDKVEEKKAARGLGASYQRQNKFKEAINYHKMVLEISKVAGECSGDTEANGAIADCYTELGDLECAAKYYDRYISLLNQATELDSQE